MASDPLIWTPSAVAGELNRILGVFDTVNSEMSAAYSAGKVSGDEWNQWHASYLSAHDFLTTASTWWGSNVNTARLQEQEAGKWRLLIASRGQPLQGPTNLVRTDPASGGLSYWTLALYGGGGLAAYLGYLYLKNRVAAPRMLGGLTKMAKRRKRKANLGSTEDVHTREAEHALEWAQKNTRKANDALDDGKCQDTIAAMLHVRRELGVAHGHLQGMSASSKKTKLSERHDAIDRELFNVVRDLYKECKIPFKAGG